MKNLPAIPFLLSIILLLTSCTRPIATTGLITQNGIAPDSNIAILQQLATKDPAAAYDMGLRYLRGQGVQRNSYNALKCFRIAGDMNDVQAQAALGKVYMTGLEEMGADLREAKKWLSLAAARGDKESETLLEKIKNSKGEKDVKEVYPNYHYWYHRVPYRLHWYRGSWIP